MTDETQTADQGSNEQSAMERLTAKMGRLTGLSDTRPAETQEATQEQASGEPDFAEIVFKGKSYKVHPDLKEGFIQNEDYTRKTQELADQRRAFEAAHERVTVAEMATKFHESVKAENEELTLIDAYLKQIGNVNWSNMNTDQMLRQRIEIDSIKERRDALQRSVEEKRSRFQDDIKTRMSELRGKSREAASKAIPGYGDEAEKAIKAYASERGFTEREVDAILLDPRSTQILHDAAQFQKVKAGTAKATEKVEKTAKVLKPGAAGEKMPAETAARLNFNKAMNSARTSGQKAAVIENRLSGLFSKHN